jgi:hypothetical protein
MFIYMFEVVICHKRNHLSPQIYNEPHDSLMFLYQRNI